MELIGPYLMACALLIGAGLAKAMRPRDTARSLAATLPLRFTTMVAVVRAGAILEVLVGAIALAVPRTLPAALVALSYVLFTGFVLHARATGGALASCGCFGTPDTPATVLHAVVNAGLATSAIAVAASGQTGTLASMLGHQPWDGVPLAGASALGAWLCFLVLSVMAELHASRRRLGVTFQRTE
jgi:hypothetical protein